MFKMGKQFQELNLRKKLVEQHTIQKKIHSTLLKGIRKTLQSGVNGEILKIMSYLLENKEIGKLINQVSERIIKHSMRRYSPCRK